MSAPTIARIDCYKLLQGLERSLGESIVRNFVLDYSFFDDAQKTRALGRIRDDLGNPGWQLTDVQPDDLLKYLDLGELVQLLDGHRTAASNARAEHIRAVAILVKDQRLVDIRKRVMHPIRPLEPDDLPTLLAASRELPKAAASLVWSPLQESMGLVSSGDTSLDVVIPAYWAEPTITAHNLPPADFDDTGFIGRTAERRTLKQLVADSDHRVITVVGAGGTGKTALALRVCHDLTDDPGQRFARIVWVSLKTTQLTADGVRQVTDAVDSVGALINLVLGEVSEHTALTGYPSWGRVINEMRSTKTLLVIDNLETIGEEVRPLVVDIPAGSKVLFTSRVGLGEIELRYSLPDLALVDAMRLFRSLASIYNYSSLRKLNDQQVKQYCEQTQNNPLLIKWFVQAVGNGGDPKTLLSTVGGFDTALTFCFDNVYDHLETTAKHVISILLAARRTLTRAQLQELAGESYATFEKACQDLVRSSVVQRSFDADSTALFQITGLVYSYLAKNHPPSNATVEAVRAGLKSWQAEQDRSGLDVGTYRYASRALEVETLDQRVAAQHVRAAFAAVRESLYDIAEKEISNAEQLAPTWWEVHRARAQIHEWMGKPIYDIEESYERALTCKNTDICHYHYAAYLMRIDDHERALEHVNLALQHKEALSSSLRGLRGVLLVRMGQLDEGLADIENSWGDRSLGTPGNIMRARGTQYADALRRRGEQSFARNRPTEAMEYFVKAATIIDEMRVLYGCDGQVAEEAIHILRNVVIREPESDLHGNPVVQRSRIWDDDERFVEAARNYAGAVKHLHADQRLVVMMPNVARASVGLYNGERYLGTIKSVTRRFGFGVITSRSIGGVHFNKASFVDQSEWSRVRSNDHVSFSVISEGRGPHALSIRMEPTKEGGGS
ncbi:MAG: NB-ARC domain-containing protein [Dehalococcoidia bacterium]|nr:NB-ARC domain-containing protein [Dehalococcoidia bacterium]